MAHQLAVCWVGSTAVYLADPWEDPTVVQKVALKVDYWVGM